MHPTRLTPLARSLRNLVLGASLSFSALPALAAETKAYHIAPASAWPVTRASGAAACRRRRPR